MAIWDDVIPAEEQAEYEKAGWGGEVGFGARPALIVVDMYRAFLEPAYPFAAATAVQTSHAILPLLTAFRERSLPVFYSTAQRQPTAAARGRWKVRATTEAPVMQSDDAYEIWPELAPREDEYVFVKTFPSAFVGTTLLSQLVFHSVDTLVVVGTVTSGCVRGTCLDAFSNSFRVIVPEQCVCDRGATSHAVALFEIQMKYGDVVSADRVLQHLMESG